MSLTLLAWLILLVTCSVLAFLHRASWGVALYMLTFFALPAFWWWGQPVAEHRWSFYGGLVLLLAVLLKSGNSVIAPSPIARRIQTIVGLLCLNATLIHFGLAENIAASSEPYWLLIKFSLLLVLITATVRTPGDLRIVVFSMLLGAGYIGYEATFNGRGTFAGGRLEGIGAPGADAANPLACLVLTVLPLAAAPLLAGSRLQKCVAAVLCACILNVIILCNSRGAFLAVFAAGVTFAILVPTALRKRAYLLVALGAVSAWMLLGDPQVVQRFLTTFAEAEERDDSANSRLTYWKAGLNVIMDYPFGSGGDGFTVAHSHEYLAKFGLYYEERAVHNGFINEACEWGIQGLFLKLALLGTVCVAGLQISRHCARQQDYFGAALGVGIIASIVGFLVACMFGDWLDAEWGYWIAAVGAGHANLLGLKTSAVPSEGTEPAADVDLSSGSSLATN